MYWWIAETGLYRFSSGAWSGSWWGNTGYQRAVGRTDGSRRSAALSLFEEVCWGLFGRKVVNKVTGVLLVCLLVRQFCDFSYFC
jgi:hypothetical protein